MNFRLTILWKIRPVMLNWNVLPQTTTKRMSSVILYPSVTRGRRCWGRVANHREICKIGTMLIQRDVRTHLGPITYAFPLGNRGLISLFREHLYKRYNLKIRDIIARYRCYGITCVNLWDACCFFFFEIINSG